MRISWDNKNFALRAFSERLGIILKIMSWSKKLNVESTKKYKILIYDLVINSAASSLDSMQNTTCYAKSS